MDPSSLIHDSAFAGSGVPAGQPGFNLAEVWQLPVGGGAAGILGARFGRDLWFPENPASAGGGNGNRDLSLEESSVTENSGGSGGGGGGGQRQRESSVPAAEATSRGNENDGSGKRLKLSGSGDENGEFKARVEESAGNGMKPVEQNAPPAELPKQDYIHVRARRGQATDSHSLAERARREKISERMKILQDLVPGCNKVIGKALVLDEIINYIQSLQRQVEFLSMKLEAVNSRISPGIEAFPTKDFGILAFDTSGMAFGSQAHREYGQGSQPEWLHMQLGGGFERATFNRSAEDAWFDSVATFESDCEDDY